MGAPSPPLGPRLGNAKLGLGVPAAARPKPEKRRLSNHRGQGTRLDVFQRKLHAAEGLLQRRNGSIHLFDWTINRRHGSFWQKHRMFDVFQRRFHIRQMENSIAGMDRPVKKRERSMFLVESWIFFVHHSVSPMDCPVRCSDAADFWGAARVEKPAGRGYTVMHSPESNKRGRPPRPAPSAC